MSHFSQKTKKETKIGTKKTKRTSYATTFACRIEKGVLITGRGRFLHSFRIQFTVKVEDSELIRLKHFSSLSFHLQLGRSLVEHVHFQALFSSHHSCRSFSTSLASFKNWKTASQYPSVGLESKRKDLGVCINSEKTLQSSFTSSCFGKPLV